MKVIVTRQFDKDVDKELSKEMQLKVADLIEELQKAPNLFSINNLKKLKGYKTAYRVKMGDYRIGFIFEQNIINSAEY
ncbi:MAG: type II toxin-antitoxin system RelE family toxin [Ginsengibacter sp.]